MNEKPTYEELEQKIKVLEEAALEARRLETAFRNSEELYNKLVNTIPDVIVRTDLDGNVVFINDYSCQISGYRRDELEGQNMLMFIAPEDWDVLLQNAILMMDGRLGPKEYRMIMKDGRKVPFEVNGDVLRNEDGTPFGLVFVCRDITKRKMADEALREAENRYLQVTENAMEIIWEVDAEGLFQYCSPAVERILGYRADELIGEKHFYDFLTPDLKETVKKAVIEQFDRHEPFRNFVCQNIDRNGKVVILEISGTPILDDKENLRGYRGAFMDITERMRAEEEKHHREKLQGILEMAGTVCHEMNQPMQVVYGLSEILLMNTSEKEPIYGKLVSIMNQLQRMNEITGKLMALQYYKTEDYAGFTRIIDIHESRGETFS